MMTKPAVRNAKHDRLQSVVVIAVAAVVAIVSARPAPTSWSDSSRLATVESLVDYRTLAIDRSIFRETGDKIFVEGHFYSHKPPVPSLLMAVVYQGLQWTTGLTARRTPDRFYRLLTIGSAGIAYVIAVWCVLPLGRRLSLSVPLCLLLAASFAIATLALTYARAVNEHILLLAVAMGALVHLSAPPAGTINRAPPWRQPVAAGFFGGLGYAIEAGTGLPLLASLFVLVGYRSRSRRAIAVFLLGALPWVVLHHALNYSIGGTLTAVAMVPEFFEWPGSAFHDASGLTGAWNHGTLGQFVTYAAELLVGKHGFLLHNLPLWVAVACLVPLLRRGSIPEAPEIICVVAWSLATWLLYAALSTNFSGNAVSIRWFVPLLAAGYYVLAIAVREYPRVAWDVLLLTALGVPWALNMWRKGPWIGQPAVNWTFISLVLAIWCLSRLPWERSEAVRWARRRIERRIPFR